MKKIKLFTFALLATLSLGMTSCLSDSSSTSTGGMIAEVYNATGTTFFVSGSTKIYPTSTSLSSVESTYNFNATSGTAYIYYTYDANSEANKNSSTTNTLTVDLEYAVSLKGTTVEPSIAGASNDSVATNPIIGLQAMSSNSEDQFTIVNNRYLVAGVNYYLSKAYHYFTLVYYPSETKSGDTTLKVYLRHRSLLDTTPSSTSSDLASSYPFYYFKSFDLKNVLTDFQSTAGAAPKNITVYAQVSTLSTGFDLSKIENTAYTITYAPTSTSN
jgi:hypothetical protein